MHTNLFHLFIFLPHASKPPKELKAREKRRKVDGDEMEGEAAKKPEDVKEKNEDVVESTQERLKVVVGNRGKVLN